MRTYMLGLFWLLFPAASALADPAGWEPGSGPDFVHADTQGQERVRLRASTSESAIETASSTQASIEPALFDWVSGLFGNGIYDSTTESSCLDAGQTIDVGKFTGTPKISAEIVQKQAKATVRLSLLPPETVDRIVKTELKIQKYDMGSFKILWSKLPAGFGGGFCTGTLLLSNIVITAGHCLDEDDLRSKGATPPRVFDAKGRFQRYMTPKEIAKLLKVDFNFQNYLVSASNPFVVIESTPFSVPVDAWITSQFRKSASGYVHDYMLLRLKPAEQDLAQYALGLRNIDYRVLAANTPLAIVQHPKGEVKQVAVGTLADAKNRQLYYSDLSTDSGSSGAGIIDRNGKLVGIHSAGGCDKAKNGYANKGVSIRSAQQALEDIRPKPKAADTAPH